MTKDTTKTFLTTQQQRTFAASALPPRPLRLTCYGSSSADTPAPYMQAALTLGFLLAQRGHTCVNGAGSYGCMAAMNNGAQARGGHIVGVIHEMWVGSASSTTTTANNDEEPEGAHPVFASTENAGSSAAADSNGTAVQKKRANNLAKREMLVVGGDDLQERKKKLVEGADGLIVLPGGPGTWDELWEMVCLKGIGLSTIPIVCVNCNGFYNSFRDMLEKAYNEGLMRHAPDTLVYFTDTPEEALEWMELSSEEKARRSAQSQPPARSARTTRSLLSRPPYIVTGKAVVFVIALGLGFLIGKAQTKRV